MKQQSRAIQARWALEKATETEATEFYQSLPLDKLLDLHKRMRRSVELCGEIINVKYNVEEAQKCKTCGKSYEEMRKSKPDWFLNRPYRDPEDPRLIKVDHFCSANCISLENNKTQGVRGIADRGMLPADNPKNHPRQVTAD